MHSLHNRPGKQRLSCIAETGILPFRFTKPAFLQLLQEAAQELAQLDAEIEFDPFKHDPRVTLKAGRRAEEFAKDAQRHLKVCRLQERLNRVLARAPGVCFAASLAWPASRSVLLGCVLVFQEALHLVHRRLVVCFPSGTAEQQAGAAGGPAAQATCYSRCLAAGPDLLLTRQGCRGLPAG